MVEIEFINPIEENDNQLFSRELETNHNVWFHGTSEESALLIIKIGFHPAKTLQSSSFARTSSPCIGFACDKRTNGGRGAILAVRFDSVPMSGIRQNGDALYLDNHAIQPEIVAYCFIPETFIFR